MKAVEKQVNNDQRLACQGPGQIANFFEMGPGPSTCSSISLSMAWRVRINFQLTHHLRLARALSIINLASRASSHIGLSRQYMLNSCRRHPVKRHLITEVCRAACPCSTVLQQ